MLSPLSYLSLLERLGFQLYFQANNIFCTIWANNTYIIHKEKRHGTPVRVSVHNDNVGKENVFLPKWHGKVNYFGLLISLEEIHPIKNIGSWTGSITETDDCCSQYNDSCVIIIMSICTVFLLTFSKKLHKHHLFNSQNNHSKGVIIR